MSKIGDMLVLVDENNTEIGSENKLKTHQTGALHRAFSIVIFDDEGRMLLQQRSLIKYHCGGLWTNTCCSHPQVNQTMDEALHKRLQFEMGFDCPLTFHHSFTYRAEFEDTGLIEHEFDHVYTGLFNGAPQPNPDEVMAYAWHDMDELDALIVKEPERFTPWFIMIANELRNEKA
ncbi:isopentenyl-diphosphate Delta-isomerase [Microvirga sp. W0021]|uniref:Isopentenyl-diphosphate Delta-isomerase n=1 Tax=Hohaiivirga grylli TaxID=3133970 RepID=A0ABV0BK63_9HYPH